MQSYVLLGAEDEGLNPGIGAKKVLDGLLLLGLRDLRVHCCAEDTQVNSAREMFLRLVGLLSISRPILKCMVWRMDGLSYMTKFFTRIVAGGGLRMVGSMAVRLCPHAEPRGKVDKALRLKEQLDLGWKVRGF